MLADQKIGQFGIGFVNLVGAAKALDFYRADDGVIAAAALADVVKQGGQIQNPRLVPACGQLGAERIFVGMLGHEEAPHIAQHHQNMLIHRIDVEQVMLHLPHDAAKRPKVATQHRGLVH